LQLWSNISLKRCELLKKIVIANMSCGAKFYQKVEELKMPTVEKKSVIADMRICFCGHVP
jgi:hypothetical protein